MKEIHCKICEHLLFKIDIDTYETEASGNKAHIKFYGNNKPLLKHIEIFTICDKCKDIDLNAF